MPQSLLWEKLEAKDVATIHSLKESSKVRAYLQDLFERRPPSWLITDPNDADVDSKNDVLLEFFFHTLRFCREKNFDFERTSTMFSIMYWVHTNSMAQKAGQEESMKILQKYLAQHSVHRPPFSEAVFDDVDVRVITRYALNTYYRNYKCYLYAFTAKEILSLTSYFGVDHIERPIVPKPLAQSMTEEEWSVKEAEQIEKEQEEEADRQALLAELEAARADADVSDPKTGPLKEMVSKMTADNWADLETKLEMIQSRVLYPSNLKDKTSFVKRK